MKTKRWTEDDDGFIHAPDGACYRYIDSVEILNNLQTELNTFRTWAQQVSERTDVPKGIRNAAKGLAHD